MPNPDTATPSVPQAADERGSKLRAGIMIGVAAAALLCIIFGSLPVKIVALVLALCVIQGLWRGATELIGIVGGMIVGVLLCRPIGRLLEPALASITHTAGLSARLLSVGLAAVVVSACVALVIGVVAKRMMKSRPQLAGADKMAGGGVGLIQGGFLGLIILWIPLALEPVARGQLADRATDGEVRAANPVAEQVVSFAEKVKRSILGTLAENTNPMEGARIFALAGDFALVMRHKQARDHFLNSGPMRTIRETPSFVDAISRLEQDPELGVMIRAGEYGPDFLRRVFTSRSLVDVLDQTTVVRDLTPLVGGIETALQEAKQIALERR